jgi:hypothetical protein
MTGCPKRNPSVLHWHGVLSLRGVLVGKVSKARARGKNKTERMGVAEVARLLAEMLS